MKINKYFILSCVLVIISIILIVKLDTIIPWVLFYLSATFFIVLLLKQIDDWGIMKKTPHRNYESFSDNGIFKFSEKGFSINDNKTQDFIEWIDIKQIISYSVTFYENPMIFIDIYTDTKNYSFNEETLGWYQLVSHIQTNLQNVSESWHLDNLIDSSNKEKVIIYNRDYSKI
ncbi:MAG: hypothetical protein MUW56_21580 [Chryseobacterium sp.]|uniref:hypothetical protein n=1 Tax=Chryseobacterium sp. TaxID=1871047 RepID=UPI0025C45478|nr:hypothetical protein [Chryseobacterium sp.]MCJ7936146.1 hypothetical protein [Chryseobacterium sp.]